MPRQFCVYILANWRKTIYIGVTSNLPRRLAQHLDGSGSAFAAEHRLRRLVLVEVFSRPDEAIAREKQLKGWIRSRKVALIEATNPGWRDLMGEWGWRRPLDSDKRSP